MRTEGLVGRGKTAGMPVNGTDAIQGLLVRVLVPGRMFRRACVWADSPKAK